MEIAKQQVDGALQLTLSGRLDSTWAASLASEIDESIREGARHLHLDMAGVPYMSSAGIRVLISASRQLHTVKGTLAVVNPSAEVRKLLALSGLDSLIGPAAPAGRDAASGACAARATIGSLRLEIHEQAAPKPAPCRLLGRPDALTKGGWSTGDVVSLSLPAGDFALGIGAFGNRPEDGWERFGEFMAVAGAAVYLPTDGADQPDYLLSSAGDIPGLQILYAVTCGCNLPHLARFEQDESGHAVTLTQLASAALEHAGADTVGMVFVAESAGLIGAALKRPPVQLSRGASLFEHPGVRQWLSFTSERAHARSLVVVAGLASRQAPAGLASFLRPVGAAAQPVGHFHAAVMPFMPLPSGDIPLAPTVAALFQAGAPQAILHLLCDSREMGVGESEFRRGALWFGPVTMPAEGGTP